MQSARGPVPTRAWGTRCATVVVLLSFVASAAVNPARAQAPAPSAAPPAMYPAQGSAPPPPAYPPPATHPPPAGYPPPGAYPPAASPYGQPGYATPAPMAPLGPPRMVHRKRRGLVVGGAITFGISWGLAATISLLLLDSSNSTCGSSCRAGMHRLWVPVIGPIWAEQADGSWNATSFPILWSVAQAAGLTMLIVGMAGKDVPENQFGVRRAKFNVTPAASRDWAGLQVRATW